MSEATKHTIEPIVLENLMKLPEPYRTEAIENAERLGAVGKFDENVYYQNPIAEAINSAFNWCYSKQGGDYWKSVVDMAGNGKFDNPVEETPKAYDFINPDHYKNGSKEVWEMMVDIWGEEAFIKHCEITAFKYRMRLGEKPEQPVERDLEKARWYESKAKELKAKRNTQNQ